MTGLIKKIVTVRVKRPDGSNFNPIRVQNREVMTFDLDYRRSKKNRHGFSRNERQEKERQERLEKWQSLTPQRQLASLDLRLGKGQGAGKQRAKILARMKKGK